MNHLVLKKHFHSSVKLILDVFYICLDALAQFSLIWLVEMTPSLLGYVILEISYDRYKHQIWTARKVGYTNPIETSVTVNDKKIFFSETHDGVRAPCGVVSDRSMFWGKNHFRAKMKKKNVKMTQQWASGMGLFVCMLSQVQISRGLPEVFFVIQGVQPD